MLKNIKDFEINVASREFILLLIIMAHPVAAPNIKTSEQGPKEINYLWVLWLG